MKAITKQRGVYIAGDLIACELATLLFNLTRHWRIHIGEVRPFGDWSADPNVALSYLAFPCVMLALFAIFGFYNHPTLKSRYEVVSNAALGSIIGSFVVYFAIVVNDSFNDRSIHYSIMVIYWLAFTIPVCLIRMFVRAAIIRRYKDVYNVVVVGEGEQAQRYAARIQKNNAKMHYNVVAVLDHTISSPTDSMPQFPIVSNEDINSMVNNGGVNAFIVLADRDHQKSSLDLINSLNSFGLTIFLPIDFFNIVTSRPRLNNISGEPLVDITSPGLSAAGANFKRVGDVVLSLLAIIILLPVYFIIAIGIKLDSKGRILYRQSRVGLHRRKFNIIKFRTMVEDAEPDGPALSSDNDDRITRCGHFLRKYRLDELPQFWNVLRGDMSLVGPRPEREYFLDKIAAIEPAVCTIHKVRPGITSLGMVKYGYASDINAMIERLYYDLLYVENISLSLDIKILFHTVNTVMTGKGI